MSHLFEVLPLAPRPEPEKPPAEAFESMEEDAATVQGSLDGILPCEKPRVEVWLADGEGVAITDVDTTLLLGGKHDGKLDGQGYLKLDDVQVPISETDEVVAELTTTEDGRHQLKLVKGPAPKDDDEEEPSSELTEEPAPYKKPPMDDY